MNNKPFDLAIGALTFRASPLPHSRKLLFLDPFPEAARDEATQPHFNFVQNAMAAATTLPRYQTIRQGIERVQGSNSTQQRLGSVLAVTGVGTLRTSKQRKISIRIRRTSSSWIRH